MSVPPIMNIETFFTIDMPYRERMEIRRTVFRGGSGPRVAVVSGLHGYAHMFQGIDRLIPHDVGYIIWD